MKRVVSLLAAIFFGFFTIPTLASEHGGPKTGPYLGIETGISIARDVDWGWIDNDIPTECDLHYKGMTGFVSEVSDFLNANRAEPKCVPRRNPDSVTYRHDFKDTSYGVTAGVTAGYKHLGGLPFRAEIEYFYRNNGYDDRTNQAQDASDINEQKTSEFVHDYAVLGDIRAHNVFANVYYDYENSSSFTPYVGVGIGWSKTDVETHQFYQRKSALQDADDDDVLQAVEGTVTSLRKTFDDDLFGVQTLVGFDYPLSEKVSVGLKFRWAWFSKFEGDDALWDTLRSHESTLAPSGSADANQLEQNNIDNNSVVRGTTKDISFWGAAISLKYHIF